MGLLGRGHRPPLAPAAPPPRRPSGRRRPHHGPLCLSTRQPVPARRTSSEHICPHPGRARLSATTAPAFSSSSRPASIPTSSATHLGERKVPPQFIMAKARHTNPGSAMRYTRPGCEAVAEITGILAPIPPDPLTTAHLC